MNKTARSAIAMAILVFGLASCEEGLTGARTSESAAAPAPTGEATTGVKDVERPDVFSTQELALWDGRPSLGGVWVAHPDVKDPERAILINQTTGQRVAGALFRRERDNPGPSLQLSSDAAAALNILAGQPTEVSVVAVRQEEIVVEQAPPVISDEEINLPDEANTSVADGAAPGTDAAGDAAIAGTAAAAAAVESRPRRGNFLERLFGRKPKETPVIEDITPEATAESASVPAVETQPLDPVAASAAAAISRAEADDKPEPRPTRTTASSVSNPYVQIGLFNVEENANAAAANLRQAGIVPSLIEDTKNGQLFWRVVAGPVTTTDDQAALLARVKQLGYADAYLTPN